MEKDLTQIKASRYIVRNILDNGDVLFLSTVSGSLIKLTKQKAIAFDQSKWEAFSCEEIDQLLRMSFLCQCDELDAILVSHKKAVESIPKQPLGVTILTTSACNARCGYCFEKGINTQTMSLETAFGVEQYLLKEHKGNSVHIGWFGGEPLLNTRVIDHISNFLTEHDIDFTSSMISNGFLIDQCSEEQLKKWNLKRIQITLDGIFEEYNVIKNYVYKDVDPFSKVISNIQRLLSIEIPVSIRINYNPSDILNAKKTLKFVYDKFKNDKNLSVYFANIVAPDILSPLELKPNPCVELYNLLIEFGYTKSTKDIGIKPKRVACGIHNNYFVVNPDGTLLKCEHMVSKKEEFVGNILEGVTNPEAYSKWVSPDLPYTECLDCVFLPCCHGNCKANAISYKKELVCLPIKNCIQDIMKSYYERRN